MWALNPLLGYDSEAAAFMGGFESYQILCDLFQVSGCYVWGQCIVYEFVQFRPGGVVISRKASENNFKVTGATSVQVVLQSLLHGFHIHDMFR